MQTTRGVVVLCFLAVLAGCLGIGGDATPAAPDPGENATATVVDVVDGDTIDVRYSDGTTDTVRLLGIDTPEVRAENEPAEFEGVPESEGGVDCLRAAGDVASGALGERIGGSSVTLVVDGTADHRDRYDRLLAYVEYDGTDINHWLVAEGHARVYDTTFARSESYYEAESAAQSAEAGVWACREDQTAMRNESANGLVVDEVRADAPGNDHENLQEEYVVFHNAGDEPLTLTGWTVRDEGGHEYVFPNEFTLHNGSTVTLVTGAGADTDETLYWGHDSAVWNNGGDTITVLDAAGQVVLNHSYS